MLKLEIIEVMFFFFYWYRYNIKGSRKDRDFLIILELFGVEELVYNFVYFKDRKI